MQKKEAPSYYPIVPDFSLFESLSPEQSTVLHTCNGRLSPLNKRTNLSNEEKARAGISIEAAYFCLDEQLLGVEQLGGDPLAPQ